MALIDGQPQYLDTAVGGLHIPIEITVAALVALVGGYTQRVQHVGGSCWHLQRHNSTVTARECGFQLPAQGELAGLVEEVGHLDTADRGCHEVAFLCVHAVHPHLLGTRQAGHVLRFVAYLDAGILACLGRNLYEIDGTERNIDRVSDKGLACVGLEQLVAIRIVDTYICGFLRLDVI